MARRIVTAALAASLLAGTGAQAQGPPDAPSIYGVWRNRKDTVHVNIQPCESGACGYVVWASAKARADAREGGTKDLIGLQLFRHFVRRSDGSWKGKIFVPDRDATFSGTAEMVGADLVRARGCLIANIVCKSQVWTRVPAEQPVRPETIAPH